MKLLYAIFDLYEESIIFNLFVTLCAAVFGGFLGVLLIRLLDI